MVFAEKEHVPKFTFESGFLGAICFHPILFYDFFHQKHNSPLKFADQGVEYKARQDTQLRRPVLLRCTDNSWCFWKPSQDEACGLRQLGYPVKLIRLNEGIITAILNFWRQA